MKTERQKASEWFSANKEKVREAFGDTYVVCGEDGLLFQGSLEACQKHMADNKLEDIAIIDVTFDIYPLQGKVEPSQQPSFMTGLLEVWKSDNDRMYIIPPGCDIEITPVIKSKPFKGCRILQLHREN